jgi:glutamate-1-semialdehyde aminotransferase
MSSSNPLRSPAPANPVSEALWERACKVIPAGTQTFSKAPNQVAPGVAPKYLVRGLGSRVWDADGHEYLDLTMGLLPVVLGYGDPAVNEAVERQLRDGPTFSLMHPLEVEVSEFLVELIPCAEMIRFGKNGSDATSAAVRLARAYTGRDVIVCCGYHGWQDWYVGTTTRSSGVPKAVAELTKTFGYNDLDSLRQRLEENAGKVAAVIMEPVTFKPPEEGFLEGVRDLAHSHGALLVFDEIITGFRFSLGGAQELFGVVPDLSTFGKAVANGFPLSGIAGPAEIMRKLEDVFFSFTFGGETLSLAAAKATIGELRRRSGPGYLASIGERLQNGVRGLIARHGLAAEIDCPGLPVWTCLSFGGPDPYGWKTLFQQECVKRGLLFISNHNTSLSHVPDDIEWTLQVYDQAFGILAEAVEDNAVERMLEGPRIEPIFRRYE